MYLAHLGYTQSSATILVQLAAHLSRWMAEGNLTLSDLDDNALDSFVATRRRRYSHHYSRQALTPVLNYLDTQGLLPPVAPPTPPAPGTVEALLLNFHHYLTGNRNISIPVADAYLRWVTPFARQHLAPNTAQRFRSLKASDVSDFLTAHLPAMTRKTAQMTACSLRSFLRFGYHANLITTDLSTAIPAVAHRRLTGVAQPLNSAQISALLDSCDRRTPAGCRDLAIITVLYRLGLRSNELANLHLDDLNWQAGTVLIRGKGGRIDHLPLPVDVGEAIVDYLHHARPITPARTVFVTTLAPYTPLSRSGISCVVARTATRAGLGTIHAHRLRHTTASQVLNAGTSLADVSHLMRHAHPTTTTVYAKTDLARLSNIARPWPGTPHSLSTNPTSGQL